MTSAIFTAPAVLLSAPPLKMIRPASSNAIVARMKWVISDEIGYGLTQAGIKALANEAFKIKVVLPNALTKMRCPPPLLARRDALPVAPPPKTTRKVAAVVGCQTGQHF
jgi:hypothetical protein